MKIGIVTLTGYDNYGNRLQNFALQEILKNQNKNNEVETIEIVYTESIKFNIKIKRMCIALLFKIIPYCVFKKYESNFFLKKHRGLKFKRIDNYREKRIYDWSIKNIKNSKLKIINNKAPLDLENSFDYFITGSDQVWNPYYYNGNNEAFFLSFANSSKRIAYAPSFGVSNIPQHQKEKYRQHLMDMKSLSVREYVGQNIIKDLTGREAQVLVDPTMMLNKDEWLQVASKPKCMPNKKYLLTYVLGNQTEEFKAFVSELAKEKELEILNLLNPYNKNTYCVDPGEFVYLINYADAVITDSFHGAVFSILMKTPFVIFERQDACVSMNSRIDTLLTTFKMKSCLSNQIESIQDIYNIDFEHVDNILKYEREKSLNYLKKSISEQKVPQYLVMGE